MENTGFLKEKYGLHKAPEVEAAARRTRVRAGEKVPQDPSARIQNYLDRFKEIVERKDPEKRERGLQALKGILYDKFVIKPEEIPESFFENQREMARNLGHGDIEITQGLRRQHAEIIITDQQTSLDVWVDYLASDDAMYPDWLKYWTIRSVVKMGEYDKEKGAFAERSKGTTKPFPELNREALAYVLDALEKKYQGKGVNLDTLEDQDRAELEKLLQAESFPKLYAWAIEKVTPASVEQLASTEGKWVKYEQGSDATPLVESLQGHGTGWCTAGESTARAQLEGGDFYVFYSLDSQGQPTIPRVAIRMEGHQIGEVRGIAEQQNLDPNIAGVVQEKLKEFPDGDAYEKRTRDMQALTTIGQKIKAGRELGRDELVFLYEIDSKIEGFGYSRDPRIEELRSSRDPMKDVPIALDCRPEQIAGSVREINKNTKAYIGKLEPGIFDRLQNVEYIYTSFPEGRIERGEVTIGGKTAEQLEEQLRREGFRMSSYAVDMIKSPEFTTQRNVEDVDLVYLSIGDLGFANGGTTEQIYRKAEELGLELCPAEVGPRLRLNDVEQKPNDYYFVAMKQITESDGYPDVFDLRHDGDALWLYGHWAKPGDHWDLGGRFIFRRHKS